MVKGIKVFSNGYRYEGEFKKESLMEKGFFKAQKAINIQENIKMERNGFGTWISGENKNDNPPEFLNSSNNKDLPLTNSKSIYYEGEWKNNKREGKGKLVIKKNGKKIFRIFYKW